MANETAPAKIERTALEWNQLLQRGIVDWDGFENRDPSAVMSLKEFEQRAIRATQVISMPRASGTEARVCGDIAARQALGLAKYGVTVEQNPLSLRQWLQHAYEETLDKAIYLRRAIEEMEEPAP